LQKGRDYGFVLEMTFTARKLEELSREDLIRIIVNQSQALQRLQQLVEELKHKLLLNGKDSTTSSKPPSSDQNQKARPKKNQSLREKSDKKSGGQPGHKGVTRKQTKPNEIIPNIPEECEKCGQSLSGLEAILVASRQEVDIPPIMPIVKEYQVFSVKCSCGQCNKGNFPEDIKAPMQIGLNMKSLISYLNTRHWMPYERLTIMAEDLLNFKISEGSIDNTLEKFHQNGKDLHQQIKDGLKLQSWLGSDETGTRVEGRRWWQWVWQNFLGSYYVICNSRGYKVIEEAFGEDYKGQLVHDCLSAQNKTVAKKGHQLCLEHLKRDLEFIIQAEGKKWGYVMKRFLIKSTKARDKIWQKNFDPQLRSRIIGDYYEQLAELVSWETNTKEANKLRKRLIKHSEKILFFMNSPDLPYHNNASEQAIRSAKIKLKISGGFRSEHGAHRYAVLQSIVETCKKQKMDVLASIKQVLLGQPLAFQWST
jgi:transposase